MADVHRDVAFMAAQIGMNAPEMDQTVNRLRGHALRLAAESRLTGAFMSSIKVDTVPGEFGRGRRIKDRLMWTDDPGAVSIEYGHKQGDKHVAGKYIFTRARNATAGGS